ncbi:acyl-CoA thioesterase domain-containing protein [Nocardia asteroides]|uniref:Thioesterase family protein n=1 Tax=Nocardia asteroides NBRC 15531 TaxID=1110697 RepID=U5E739_NOCAS|nr:acyl-CoA thioesterase domain-containing protein [Nocardia asteroides]UGT51053.1 thioesterase family protein [Nocardia asteroides]GAD85757.1 hypothetical protein NCAST_32_02400 [Nocardia asteroides NBRC 15531]SFN40314.1 Thioesterase-like superfamily protein [Nocardia asteroides]VEG36080.1 Uncharacterised protein [Nocardia asteroides]
MSAEQPAAYFRRDGAVYTPTSWGRSLWADGLLSGPPVCGLLAREIDDRFHDGDFAPARFTVDLHQPVPAVPLTVDSEPTRDGNRVRAATAVLRADGEVVARASAVLLKRSAQPPGEVWRADRRPPLPPPSVLAAVAPTVHLFDSDGSGAGWTVEISRHENDSRKRKWVRPIAVVAGEPLSPFCSAAMAGEQASLVTNWGTEGIGFINTDVSITFARLPRAVEMGIEADDHLSSDGIAAGAAMLYDADGVFALCTVSAVANERRQISGAAIDAYIPARGGAQRV